MKLFYRLWLVIFGIIIIWIYFIFISPKIFHNTILTIPNIVNLKEEEAISLLKENKIEYQITYLEDKDEVVKKTIPYPGTKIKKGNRIEVYIGKIMPNSYHSYLGQIYALVQEDIERMCKENGLILKIEYEEHNDMPGQTIIRESLVDGSSLNHGDELILTIVSNKNSFIMPNLVGMHLDDALALFKETKIKININYYQTPIEEDIVLYQSTAPNTIISIYNNSIIDLYVSKSLDKTTVVNVDEFIQVIELLNFDLEVNYVSSSEISNKLVAFQVQKLYDNNRTKYILWITK
ncbi:MAG: PASTA domain-containing protein [Anaeroplasmataceae bacterium]|nr:PASTA domain-containing protein [Anaeroplasmataceae bacterium]